MERTKLIFFKRMLCALLERQPLRKRCGLVVAERNADELDQVQATIEQETAIQRMELDFYRVRDVKAALERLEDGAYGYCLRCAREISIMRLRAVPWALFCLECQDLADREPGPGTRFWQSRDRAA